MGKKGFSRKAIVKSAMTRPKLEETEVVSETVDSSVVSEGSKDGQAIEVTSGRSASPEVTEDRSARFLLDSEQPSTSKVLSAVPSVSLKRDGLGTEEDGAVRLESKGQLVQRHKRVKPSPTWMLQQLIRSSYL